MRPEVKKAHENGSFTRINQLWSAIFQLNTLSNNMVEEISDILAMNDLRDGRLKYLHNHFVKAADKFYDEFKKMVKDDMKMEIFKDMDEYKEKIYNILSLAETWEPSTNTESNEQ